MNYRIICIVSILTLFISCSSSKRSRVDNSVGGRAKVLLSKAHDYFGTPYKYGGDNSSGMDCSGLTWLSYKEIGIELPRNSAEQAKYGTKVSIKRVKPGDMLFFNTSGRDITHVGIVDYIREGEVFFIHASSSRGVMVSSLDNKYWNKRFVKAVRYLH